MSLVSKEMVRGVGLGRLYADLGSAGGDSLSVIEAIDGSGIFVSGLQPLGLVAILTQPSGLGWDVVGPLALNKSKCNGNVASEFEDDGHDEGFAVGVLLQEAL